MPDTPAPRSRPNVTLAVLALGGVAYALLQSLVAPAMPDIQKELGVSSATISWILTGYLLSASVATPIIGRLGDMFGKERVLLIVLVALALGTLMAAVSTSIGMLIAARVIQGAGGGIFPLAFGIIRDEFPRDRVASGIGLMSTLLGLGGGLGVVLAGVIVQQLDYHWLFWLPLVAIVAAAILTKAVVPESPVKTPGKINWLAAALMSAGLTGLMLAISQGEAWGWTSPKTLGLAVVGVALLLAWVRAENRSDQPLVDMRMMRIRGVWTTNVVALLLGVGMYSSFILVPEFVQLPTSTGFGFGASVTAAGLFLLPSTLMMLLVGPLAGRLEGRFGSKPPLLVGSGFAAASFLLLVVADGARIDVYVSMGLLGIGIGLAFAALANLIVQAVRQDQTGVATGMNTVMRTLGGAVGGTIAAVIISGSTGADGVATESGFTLAFAMCAGSLILAVAAGMLIPGRSRAEGARVRSARREVAAAGD